MLHKIWLSFRYGNKKTKSIILSVGALFVLAVICLVMLITTKFIIWGLGTFFALILAVIFISTVSFGGEGKNIGEKSRPQEKKEILNRTLHDQTDQIEEEEEESRTYLLDIKQADVHKILIKNKVKREHLPVMIDYSKEYDIRQCPAYIWVSKNYLYILLLEKQPRRIKIPRLKLNQILFHPGVTARRLIDYEEFQKPSFISLTFGSLLPVYYEEIERNRTVYKKNLYVIDPDIMFTNNSIHAVMKLLGLDVTIKDKVTSSNQYSDFYKEAYKINRLWKDGVYSSQEFKAKIKDMLKKISESNISTEAFIETMKELVRGRLITKEYAEYYIEYKEKEKRRVKK